MTILHRWLAFNLVGALGMLLQLATLFCLNRLLPGHYLLSSALALELTLLHNFCWHRRTTWRDRAGSEPAVRQLFRFHLTNGLVSLTGNLLLMRVLVHTAHLPVVVSNAVAILLCALLNFGLAHGWAFRGSVPVPVSLVCALLLVVAGAEAQGTALPQDTSAKDRYLLRCVPHDAGEDCTYTNVFAGPVIAAGNGLRASGMAGVTIGQYFTRATGKGLIPSPQFELGLVGPLPGGHAMDGLASFDLMFSGKLPRQPRFLFANAGYTRLFVTGNAVNFGVGLDLGRRDSASLLRLELRDYFLFTGPRQHVIGLRIAFGSLIVD